MLVRPFFRETTPGHVLQWYGPNFHTARYSVVFSQSKQVCLFFKTKSDALIWVVGFFFQFCVRVNVFAKATFIISKWM